MNKYKLFVNIAELFLIVFCILPALMSFYLPTIGSFICGIFWLVCAGMVGSDLVLRATNGKGFVW